MHQRRHLSGNTRRQRAIHRCTGNRLPCVIEIHIPCGGKRRLFAPIDHDFPLCIGTVQQPEPATSKPGAVGFHNGERGADSNRCIESIAAGFQYFHAGTACIGMGCGNRCGARLTGCPGQGKQQQTQRKKTPAQCRGFFQTAVRLMLVIRR